MPTRQNSRRTLAALTSMAVLFCCAAVAAETPAACPVQPTRVARSVGGVTDNLGATAGIAELCRIRRGNDEGEYYFGVWRSDWPGAGQAYPAMRAAILGPKGTKTSFVTRTSPGLQWIDSFVNEGLEPMVVNGQAFQTLKLAHEREGIEGNTYHSVITSWRDVATGISLKVVETQIAGQSYGPETTWTAVQVGPLP